MKLFLSDIKLFIGRGAKLNSEVITFLLKKYNSSNPAKFNVAISRYVKEGLLFCSKPITFDNGEYALSCGHNHNYSKYLPLIRKKSGSLSRVIDILKNGCGYISIFNLRKILVLDTNNINQLNKAKDILSKIFSNIVFNNEYCYTKKPAENDKQNLYEKNRDRILYSVIKKHESENIIFGHSIYYKTSQFSNISAAYLTFDAYSKSSVFQEDRNSKTYLVYDFAIDEKYSLSEAKSFNERSIKLSKRLNCKVVPISIFNKADEKTIAYLKNNAIVYMTFNSILGKDSEEFLSKMSSIDKNEYNFENFNYVLKVVNSYNQFDSIKGGLFEHLCAAVLDKMKRSYDTTINCNYHLKGKNNNLDLAQFDILIKTYDGFTIICECKSYKTKMLYGEKQKYGTYSYFLNQVDKYKEEYPNETVKFLIFSANGFQQSIEKECGNSKLSEPQEYTELPLLCDYEKLNGCLNSVNEYLTLWETYYLNK